ncbi:nuclease-related domain-containing protein [Salinactinospora qingdaonensis]|uniref:NERD domain-containing protein n=1 Tax=Salinactinospora qingdaonensis TaxID=702744 RepID=A0ABP7GBB7_9ACTN
MVKLIVRTVVVAAAGIMAWGFLGRQAGVLVAGLVALSYLLLSAAPRMRAPWGRGRLLRTLQRRGYHIVADGTARHLAVGPSGIYLLETRAWRYAVSRPGGRWRIGATPAAHVVDQLTAHAALLEHSLGLANTWPGVSVVPVLAVVGRLPEPVMRSGNVVLARGRTALDHILASPEILSAEEVSAITARADQRLP